MAGKDRQGEAMQKAFDALAAEAASQLRATAASVLAQNRSAGEEELAVLAEQMRLFTLATGGEAEPQGASASQETAGEWADIMIAKMVEVRQEVATSWTDICVAACAKDAFIWSELQKRRRKLVRYIAAHAATGSASSDTYYIWALRGCLVLEPDS